MRFLLLLPAALLAACTVTSEDTGTQADDLVTAVWTEDQAQSIVYFNVQGGGDVAVGSGCAPGQTAITLHLPQQSISGTECAGAPARLRSKGIVKVGDEQWVELIAAARSVRTSSTPRCDLDAPTRSATMSVSPAAGATFAAKTFTTDRAACASTTGTYAVGIEKVLEIAEPLLAAVPLPPPTVIANPPPAPATVWGAGSDSFTLAVYGSGNMPLGSTCLPGTKNYSLRTPATGAWTLSTSSCEPLSGVADGRLAARWATVTLTDAEVAAARAALTTLRPSPTATCAPGAEYVLASVTSQNPGGTAPTSTLYRSSKGACVFGIDNGPYLDVTQVRAALERIDAAH